MKILGIVAVAACIAHGGVVHGAFEPLPVDGYCVLSKIGATDPVRTVDYNFDYATGKVTLLTAGNWELTYQSREPGDPAAVPVNVLRIEQSASGISGDLTIRATGANLADSIYLPATGAPGAKAIKLSLTGSFLDGARINAPEFTLTDCVIAGDVPATSNGITALTISDDGGVGLQIGGEMADTIDLGGSVAGTIDISRLSGKLDIGSSTSHSFSGTMLGDNWLVSETTSRVHISGDITSSASITLTGDWGQT